MKKFLKYVLLPALIVLGIWCIINRKHLAAFPHIISSYYAKEFCSCYYVTHRSAKDCHNTVRSFISLSKFSIDENKKTIYTSGLGHSSEARYIGEGQGCLLK